MYRLHFILSAAALLLSQVVIAQGLLWAKSMGGTNIEIGHSIAVDQDGNVISTGRFHGTVDFDPGPAVQNLVSSGANRDAFIQKLNPGGDLIWAKRIGGTDNDFGVSMAVDSSGNIYTLGAYADIVDFDPGPGTAILEEQYGAMFILKLDPAGNFAWVKSVEAYPYNPGLADNFGDAIKIDRSGNIYVTTGFNDTVDFDPGPGTYWLTSAGTSALWDAVILKLNPDGDFLWAKQMGSASYDSGMSIDVDQQGNVYSTGYFTQTADFDPGPDTFNLTSLGGYDLYIQKLDSSGNFIWAKTIGQLLYDQYGYGLAVNADGDVYVSGTFNSTNMDFDPGPGVFNMKSAFNDNIFILKLNTLGDFVWAKQMGGQYGNETSRNIRLDRHGNIYNIGEFVQTADFDPGPGVAALTAFGNQHDIYIQKLDPDGNHVWVKQLGGIPSDRSAAIAIDPTGEVYATGSFYSTADFDPSENVLNLTAVGQQDAFVCRLGVGYYWDFHGVVFEDKNLNGVQDSSETGIPNTILKAQDRAIFATSSSTGAFQMYYNVIGDTVRPVIPERLWYWTATPQFAVPNSERDSANFAFSILPGIKDVGISVVEKTFFRPGFQSELVVEAHNYGSSTADSVRVTFEVNSLPIPLEFVSAQPAPIYASADSVVWLIDSLRSSETATMHLSVRTLPTTPLNSTISFHAKAQLENDAYLPNNFFGTRSTVQGSYDPNDKRVFPEELPVQELDSTRLQYVIRFQNTGNLPADFVVIRDTLPFNLDISTIEVISASHSYTWKLFDKGVLEVRFDSIFLPDSLSNESGSHGFVVFTAKPKDNLMVGNMIVNRAGIYFDFNAPVITDYAKTKITTLSSIVEAGKKDWLEFGLRPNPVSRHSSVIVDLPLLEPTLAATINLYNMQGKLLQKSSAPAGSRELSIQGLPAGTYWLQVRMGRLLGVKLLVVE